MPFCPSCGQQLSDQDSKSAFCMYCGASLQTPNKGTTSNNLTPTPKPSGKKFLPIAIGAIIAVVALILILVFFSDIFPSSSDKSDKDEEKQSSSSYVSPIEDYIKLINKQETSAFEAIYALSPDFRAKLLKNMYQTMADADSDYFEDELESMEEFYNDIYDEINDEYDDWKIDFEIEDETKMDKDDLEDIQDYLDDYWNDRIENTVEKMEYTITDEYEFEDFVEDLDTSEEAAKKYVESAIKYAESFEDVEVEEAYEVEGYFTIKADNEEWESDTTTLILVKVNGDWAYTGLGDGASIVFDSDDEELQLFYPLFYALRNNYLEFIN